MTPNLPNLPIPNPLDLIAVVNPFSALAEGASKIVADGWTGIMLTIWSAGLSVLKFALTFMDAFLTPDLSADGPGSQVYRVTFWGAGALVLIMGLIQLGVAAFRRDGQSLARVLIGVAQFAVVWAGWITYGIAVVAASGALTRALMQTLLKVDAWSAWQPMDSFEVSTDGMDAVLATVLGMLGLFLWIAAIGHFVVMLARAAALLILVAVTPIAAAGLVSDAGRSWFWKSLRWFHAAALTPVLMVLMIGTGVQLTSGVALGKADGAQAALGTALPGTMLILVSVVAPVALFRLLAFVDPGTSSGASMRQGLNASGGFQGLLSGSSGSGSGSTASTSDDSGRSAGEGQSESATTGRFATALGKFGGAFGAGVGAVTKTGATAASTGVDVLNQASVGDSSYFPDHQHRSGRFNPDARTGDDSGAGDTNDQTPAPTGPLPPAPPATPPAAGGDGSAGGAAAAAGEVPPVA